MNAYGKPELDALRKLNDDTGTVVEEQSSGMEARPEAARTSVASETFASLDTLVAGVAHELNTPIGNCLLAATTLAEKVGVFATLTAGEHVKRSALNSCLADVDQAAQLIVESISKAATLISAFKRLAASQSHEQLCTFNLLSVLEGSIAAFKLNLCAANCSILLEVTEAIEMVSFSTGLAQIIEELISNALCHAFHQHPSPSIVIQARKINADIIEILVIDNGTGIAQEVVHRVFEPFFTTKLARGGIGLGMTVVYNMVHRVLGGTIDIVRTSRDGTAVRLLVPATAPSHRAA